jgi:hypothetical protein
MTRFMAVVAASAAALVWSGIAFGSGSAAAQGHAGTAAGNVQNALAQTGGGVLPFTGLSVALVVAAGLLLLAMGVTIRRLSRARA